ncbi:unnamed protein product [Gulo gulo]|uniref:Uncharacterized protein n=1 Tax=Gulo gulo TaxID=48420 RepID=A0A9X9LQW4_GULGU|nr:unnamed protein product [Gulo gulo]
MGFRSRTEVQCSTTRHSGLGGVGGLPRTRGSCVREECVSTSLLSSFVVFCKDRDQYLAWTHHSPSRQSLPSSCPVPLLVPDQTQTCACTALHPGH